MVDFVVGRTRQRRQGLRQGSCSARPRALCSDGRIDETKVVAGSCTIAKRWAQLHEHLFTKLPPGQRSVIAGGDAPTVRPNSSELARRTGRANSPSARR